MEVPPNAEILAKPREGIVEAMVPDTGRGGPASTSDALISSRPGGFKFLTQAVGRRFNSRGDAFAGQVALLVQ